MENTKKIFFILILLSSVSFAQLSDSLRFYYKNVNQAELEITKNNFKKAYEFYKEAFHYKKHPFEVDHFNFALCCSKLNKNRQSFDHVTHLVNYGYSMDSLLKNKELKYLHEKKWIKKLMLSSKSLLFDTNVRKKLDSMLILDQKFRNKRNYEYINSIYKIDSLNAVTLQKMAISQNCFSEQVAGVDFTSFKIILMHNYQNLSKGINVISLYDTILSSVYKGELDVRKAAYFIQAYDNQYKLGLFMGGIVRYSYIYDENGIEKTKELTKKGIPKIENTLILNENRFSLGLSTYEEYLEKLKFQHRNTNFRFADFESSVIYLNSKEVYDKLVNKLIFLE